MADPITIGLGVAALGYGVYSGEEQKSQARTNLRRQQAAQEQAQQAALGEQRRVEEQRRATNRKTPDISSLLAFEQQFQPFGGGPQKPADPSRMRLNRPTLGSP